MTSFKFYTESKRIKLQKWHCTHLADFSIWIYLVFILAYWKPFKTDITGRPKLIAKIVTFSHFSLLNHKLFCNWFFDFAQTLSVTFP